ncbi:MAG: EAL domain-containing protein [Lachnospiraceae bacterium]|nr:EAL domain-containing protein [Lachnospiraceae bacterium]
MWNFSFIFPTLLILIILLISYFSLPRLDIRRNRVFVHMMVIGTLCILFDILSSMMDNEFRSYPLFLVHLLNILFFIFFYIRSYAVFAFTASIIRTEFVQKRSYRLLYMLPLLCSVVTAILSPVTGSLYTIEEDGYHSGSMYFPTVYVCSVFYLILSFLVIILRDRKSVREKEVYSLKSFNLILFLGILCRYSFPHYLLMDTFYLMALLVVYLNIENPEFNLDQKIGTFNRRALAEYIDEHIADRDRKMFGLIIHKYGEMLDIYGSRQLEEGIRMIGAWLSKNWPEYDVFYVSRGRFVLVGNLDMNTELMKEVLGKRFKDPFRSDSAELYMDVDFATIELTMADLSTDVILNSLATALDKADAKDDHIPVAVTGEDLAIVKDKIRVKRLFEDAIEHDNIEIFLQPLIDASRGCIVGAEVLSRIRDDNGKIVPPSLFIPVAENSGKINNLGEQVFEKTCRFIKDNDLKSLGIQWINVNLSPLQFLRSDLAEKYSSIAEKYQIDPGILHLEITEESLVDDSFFQKQVEALTGKGFFFVLDDYGTGYSNLSRLKKCPFISIKLDMEVVRDYCGKPDGILPMMIQAFKQMGFSVTAEGIENEEMAERMKEIGCDYFQGYLYSKPVSAEEFLRLLCSGSIF